jgi:predicted nucleic acid-binding protein
LHDVFCNTSPLQYLHQLGLLSWLQTLAGRVVVPPAVAQELSAGRAKGLDVPDVANLEWIEIRIPSSLAAVPLVTDLGAGETQVLALALESSAALVLLDDGLARRVAASLGLTVEGTLGLLLDAKQAGLVPFVAPLLDQLQSLGFWLDARTRAAVLRLAGEG